MWQFLLWMSVTLTTMANSCKELKYLMWAEGSLRVTWSISCGVCCAMRMCVYFWICHMCVFVSTGLSHCVCVTQFLWLFACVPCVLVWCVPPVIWYGVYHIGKLTLPLYLFQAKHTQTGFTPSLSFSRWARLFDSNVIKQTISLSEITWQLLSPGTTGPSEDHGQQTLVVGRALEKTQVTHPSKSSTWSFFTVSLVTKSVQNRLLLFDGVSGVGTCGLVVQFVRL